MSQETIDVLNRRMIEELCEYRVIIAGGRFFNDYDLLRDKCDSFLQNKQMENIIIVSGHATGADALGEKYAQEKGHALEIYPADWKRHGRAAGPIRNAQMASIADAIIAFWDGKSRGTKSMIDLANKKGLQVVIVRYDN